MFREYREIKRRNIGQLVISDRSVLYRRKIFDPLTGEQKGQLREDVLELGVLNKRRQELVNELNDIDELIADLQNKIKEIPPKINEVPRAGS